MIFYFGNFLEFRKISSEKYFSEFINRTQNLNKMEVEQIPKKEKRSIFSAEIEELLERERNARQNNLHHQSIEVLKEIVKALLIRFN